MYSVSFAKAMITGGGLGPFIFILEGGVVHQVCWNWASQAWSASCESGRALLCRLWLAVLKSVQGPQQNMMYTKQGGDLAATPYCHLGCKLTMAEPSSTFSLEAPVQAPWNTPAATTAVPHGCEQQPSLQRLGKVCPGLLPEAGVINSHSLLSTTDSLGSVSANTETQPTTGRRVTARSHRAYYACPSSCRVCQPEQSEKRPLDCVRGA